MGCDAIGAIGCCAMGGTGWAVTTGTGAAGGALTTTGTDAIRCSAGRTSPGSDLRAATRGVAGAAGALATLKAA